MQKLVKYIFIYNVYKRVRKNIFITLLSLFFIVISIYFFNDMLQIVDSNSRSAYLAAKWVTLFFLLAVATYNISKILKAIATPLKKVDTLSISPQKEKILSKEQLVSRSDLIISKYKKSKK